MSAPILYEQIVIHSPKQFESLQRAVKESDIDLAPHIKAVCIACTTSTQEQTLEEQEFLNTLPNIVVFARFHLQHTIWYQPPSHWRLVSLALYMTCPTWAGNIRESVRRHATTLRILDVSFPSMYSATQVKLPYLTLEFGQLHTLVLGQSPIFALRSLKDIANRWYAPRLLHIHGLGEDFPDYLLAHAAVESQSPPSLSVQAITWCGPTPCRRISKVFHNVEDIMIADFNPMDPSSPIPSCTRVGLVLAFPPPYTDWSAPVLVLRRQLLRLTRSAMFPNLKTVRVVFCRNKLAAAEVAASVPGPRSPLARAFFSIYDFWIFWECWVDHWRLRVVFLEVVEENEIIAPRVVRADAPSLGPEELKAEYEARWMT
jgi:hypothetical protein